MRATVLTPAFQSGSLEVGNTHDKRATVLTPAFQSGLLAVDNTHDVRATILTPAFQSGLPTGRYGRGDSTYACVPVVIGRNV